MKICCSVLYHYKFNVLNFGFGLNKTFEEVMGNCDGIVIFFFLQFSDVLLTKIVRLLLQTYCQTKTCILNLQDVDLYAFVLRKHCKEYTTDSTVDFGQRFGINGRPG